MQLLLIYIIMKMDGHRENNLNNNDVKHSQTTSELDRYRQLLTNDVEKLTKNDIKYKILHRLVFHMKHSGRKTQSEAISLIGDYITNCDLFGHYCVKYDVASDVISLLNSKNIELENSVYNFLTTTLSNNGTVEEQEIRHKRNTFKKFQESIIKSNNLEAIILRTLNRSIEINSIKSALLLLDLIIINKNTTYEQISCTLPALVRYLFHNNRNIATLSCQVIHSFSLISGRTKEAIIEASLVKFFIDSVSDPQLWLQQNPDERLIRPIIDTMISLLSHSNPMKQVFIDCNILKVSKKLLRSNYRFMVSFGCIIVDYICQGSGAQIDEAIDSNLFPLLFDVIKHEKYNLKIKATRVILQASYHGTIDEMNKLADQQCLQTLCASLDYVGDRLIDLTLMTINNFLIAERRHISRSNEKIYPTFFLRRDFPGIVKNCNIIEKIKMLSSHNKMSIRNNAIRILRNSFGIYPAIGGSIPNDIAYEYEDSNIEECKICFERMSDTMLMPCGHRCLCNECATHLFDSNDAIELCPVCRQNAIYGKHIERQL